MAKDMIVAHRYGYRVAEELPRHLEFEATETESEQDVRQIRVGVLPYRKQLRRQA
jgi:hypothetical protein